MDSRSAQQHSIGWGMVTTDGSEIWDAMPVFLGDRVRWQDWFRLVFYPKKFWLYLWINKTKKQKSKKANVSEPFRVLDVGCGTGATLIDLKKMLGRSADVVGVDVVHMEVDLAREKARKHGVWVSVEWYDGERLPFANASFDVVYSSDVLGHVKHVSDWLSELNRVLKPGGTLAMFSESKLGKHAMIRNYLYNRGLNVDPHAQFHISLYSKNTLKLLLDEAGFTVKRMYTTFWASFFVHPDEFYEKLQAQRRFFFLRLVNNILFKIKKRFHPYTTAAAELYGFFEMLLVGWFIEAQGYIILARKKK